MWDWIQRIFMWDWLSKNWTQWGMVHAYLACAATGGSILLAQFGLSMFGLGGDELDVDADIDPTDVDVDGDGGSLNFLSIRALAGFLTFFGLVGWAGTSSGWHPAVTAGAAGLAGGSVMFFIAWIMRLFVRLSESGNIKPSRAVGLTAQVYLRVPSNGTGKGKITVSVDAQSLELAATTKGPELPTGSACRVLDLITEDTVEVQALES